MLCRNPQERALIEQRLFSLSYYKLEEYTWPFRKVLSSGDNKRSAYFKQPVSINLVWNTYLFDRRLRILIIDAIERIESAFKNQLTQILTEKTQCNNPHSIRSLFPKPIVSPYIPSMLHDRQ